MKARMWKAKGYSCDLCHICCIVCFLSHSWSPSRFAAFTKHFYSSCCFQPFCALLTAKTDYLSSRAQSILGEFDQIWKLHPRTMHRTASFVPRSLSWTRRWGDLFWTKNKHRSCELTQTHNEAFFFFFFWTLGGKQERDFMQRKDWAHFRAALIFSSGTSNVLWNHAYM